ncbi:4-hydroxythreonine-4-phosphate dehydrogenase PdxA [Youngiibacter multivorans]|uniref:4-hydroxythreonine-4-phosphate dehydrogenase n=1 Tax=Youngiibacter multivorans TaxID=937251 RepID=A0ABS4G301_9CLOT|nr:4-hydroxythreonine-4-phosphate dehydrogenase PdxA [Youngiibacter multivorans]MBP1918933.1 4-hydroxythreonine-4-phosphate dehydrogenase [Youngiibacter multivorans]
MKEERPILGIPLGDAAGIGPELVAKLAAKGVLSEHSCPVIIGDERLLIKGIEIAGVSFEYKRITHPEDIVSGEGILLLDTESLDTEGLRLSEVSASNGKEEADNLVRTMDWCKEGYLEGFCFAPLNKAAMKLGGYEYESEHELFADKLGVAHLPHGEMNVLEDLWTSRVTSHIPLSEVSRNITVERVMDAITLANDTLRRGGFTNPRIVIAAINPHGGDSGTCGREEIDVLEPAVRLAAENGIRVDGPFPSDTVFLKAFKGDYDAVVTMYHDQGQIAMKLKGFQKGITVAAGQPYAITTPAHGTAYDIAGKGIADTGAFEAAFRLCARMALSDRENKRK